MNRRQFLKQIGVACAAVIAVPIALTQKKDKLIIGSKDNYIESKNIAPGDSFHTSIIRKTKYGNLKAI